MGKLAEYVYPPEVMAMAGPITTLLDRGLVLCGEAALASLALWLVENVHEKQIPPEVADQVFTLLDLYLTDNAAGLELSEEAQELIFEGEHFHHAGDAWGPDTNNVQNLALTILSRLKN